MISHFGVVLSVFLLLFKYDRSLAAWEKHDCIPPHFQLNQKKVILITRVNKLRSRNSQGIEFLVFRNARATCYSPAFSFVHPKISSRAVRSFVRWTSIDDAYCLIALFTEYQRLGPVLYQLLHGDEIKNIIRPRKAIRLIDIGYLVYCESILSKNLAIGLPLCTKYHRLACPCLCLAGITWLCFCDARSMNLILRATLSLRSRNPLPLHVTSSSFAELLIIHLDRTLPLKLRSRKTLLNSVMVYPLIASLV